MTLAHFLYIPGVLLFGVVVGYILGSRSAQIQKDDAATRKKRAAERARKRVD